MTGDRTPGCRRCGTCCRKGGPALHRQDLPAIQRGAIALKYLYTLRKGERVRENVRGGVVNLAEELIKIKEGPDGRACIFFDDNEKGCIIYDRRPLECRILKCWDTREIEAIYDRDRLCRRDLLEALPHLWDLAAFHQEECDLEPILKGHPDRREVNRIMACDSEMRRLVPERTGLDPEILDFLLGRPLSSIMTGGRRQGRPVSSGGPGSGGAGGV